jgi:hypothetical protein
MYSNEEENKEKEEKHEKDKGVPEDVGDYSQEDDGGDSV